MFTTLFQTTEGPVRGFLDTEHNVLTWRGVPFAARAIGENRYRAPQPAVTHSETLDCTEFAPKNYQFHDNMVEGEEGVLTLDIYRPNTDEENLPLLVYFHGGNNQTQCSRIWQGSLLAQLGHLVFVSVQYRLGVLGFNCLPCLKRGEDEYEDSGNYNLLDQAASLDWIKANAAALGANGEDITVSGISSGARNIMVMLTSPYFAGKFQKAIPMSGGCTIADVEPSQRMFAAKLAPLVVEDGVQPDLATAKAWLLQPLPEVKEYLMGIEAKRLAPIMAGACIRMSAFPHLYGDGKLLPKEGFNVKKFHKVPLLLLASTDEFSLFCFRSAYFNTRLEDLNDPASLTAREYAFANKYGSLLNYYFNTHETALNIYDRYEAPIYVAQVAYAHDPATVGQFFAAEFGAFHSNISFLSTDQDKPVAFVDVGDRFTYPGVTKLRQQFLEMLAAFIHTGNPNIAALPGEWPAWTPEKQVEAVFDADHDEPKLAYKTFSFSEEELFAGIDNDHTIDDEHKKYLIANILNGRWFSGPIDKHYGNPSLWTE